MADPILNDLLRKLLDDLEAVEADHMEICDTVCREHLFEAILRGFLKPVEGYALPESFRLYEDEGNARVRVALGAYIEAARARAEAIGLDDPNDRLEAFNAPVYSSGGQSADEYFGWLERLD